MGHTQVHVASDFLQHTLAHELACHRLSLVNIMRRSPSRMPPSPSFHRSWGCVTEDKLPIVEDDGDGRASLREPRHLLTLLSLDQRQKTGMVRDDLQARR